MTLRSLSLLVSLALCTPLAWVVAPLAILGCAYLFWSLPQKTQLYFLAWNVVGFVLYVAYARRNSLLGR